MGSQGNASSNTHGEQRTRYFRRHPRRALLIVNLVGFLLLFGVAELGLRIWGYRPGWLEWGWANFNPLPDGEPLVVNHSFYTDSLGIWKASREAGAHAPEIHVNSDGFRGPEFEPQDSSRPKVMLIGDSFTWGATAQPIDSSYADLLRAGPWQVMNFGIPGADPDQYAQIARTYLPRMRPDLVCLFFYAANDRMDLPQQVLPGQSRYHLTNVGWLNPFVDGSYIGDAQATYDYFVQRFRIPPTSFVNRLCAMTAVGTQAWRGMLRMGWVREGYPPDFQAKIDASRALHDKGPYAGGYISEVAASCAEWGVPLRIFFMPAHNRIAPPDSAELQALLGGQPFLMPDDLVAGDYMPRPDGHFNNAGHRKMADFAAHHIALALQRP